MTNDKGAAVAACTAVEMTSAAPGLGRRCVGDEHHTGDHIFETRDEAAARIIRTTLGLADSAQIRITWAGAAVLGVEIGGYEVTSAKTWSALCAVLPVEEYPIEGDAGDGLGELPPYAPNVDTPIAVPFAARTKEARWMAELWNTCSDAEARELLTLARVWKGLSSGVRARVLEAAQRWAVEPPSGGPP